LTSKLLASYFRVTKTRHQGLTHSHKNKKSQGFGFALGPGSRWRVDSTGFSSNHNPCDQHWWHWFCSGRTWWRYCGADCLAELLLHLLVDAWPVAEMLRSPGKSDLLLVVLNASFVLLTYFWTRCQIFLDDIFLQWFIFLRQVVTSNH
jgi:hypothetical protein